MNARISTLIDFLFLRDSHAATIVIATAPIVATWSLLVFTRDTLPQNSMTWDLMHALAGGWYLREGLSAHGDFITQMGYLSFLPIHLGMFLTGPSVFAFHAVTAMALALVYPLCILACHRRVATFQSWIVTLALSAIVLLPTNIGEGTGVTSFAMYYNRIGWSLISIVCIFLFLKIDRRTRFGAIELSAVFVCVLVLFYLKITYFVVAVAAVYLEILFGPYFRGRRTVAATVLGGLLLAFGLPPFNLAYLSDLYVAAFRSDTVVQGAGYLLVLARNNIDCWMLVVVAVGIWLAAGGRPTLYSWLVLAFLLGGGFALLSQNAQGNLIPLVCVAFLFLFESLRRRWLSGSPEMVAENRSWILVASLVSVLYPLVFVADGTAAISRYAAAAGADDPEREIARAGPLAGLSVPRDRHPFEGIRGTTDPSPDPWRRGRTPRQGPFLSQHEYLRTMNAAVALARDLGLRDDRLLVVDQVNFLPFALGAPPPTGVYLWLLPGFHPIPPETYFAGVDGLFVPRYATAPFVTGRFMEEYASFIARTFTKQVESPYWTVLARP
jgi:hypothetical protein